MTKSRPELYGQTALRGVAALTVFIAHAAYFRLFHGNHVLRDVYQIFFWHNEAVDLFFVLSGFILCYVYAERDFKWHDYFVARFARIYPVYAVTFVVSLLILAYDFERGRGSNGFGVYPFAANVFLIQNWPLLPLVLSLNIPTWSMSVEAFLYIAIFPCLFLLNRYLSYRQKWILIILPIVANALVVNFTWTAGDAGMDAIWPPFDAYRGILCFTSGFFVCAVGLQKTFPALFSARWELLILVAVALSLMLQFPFNRKIAILGFPLLAYLSAEKSSLLSRGLSGKWFVWLGDISYSIYVWHWPLIHLVTMALARMYTTFHQALWESPLILVVLSMTAVLGISHVSHFYFERPVSKWLRKRWAKGIPPVATIMK